MTVALAVIVGGSVKESLAVFGFGLALQGAGLGLAMPSLTSSISNAVPEKDLGIASAANRLTGQTGAAFGITVLTMVYGGSNTGGSFGRAFAVGALLTITCAYWLLAQGSITVAPILLVVGYVFLVPLAIIL